MKSTPRQPAPQAATPAKRNANKASFHPTALQKPWSVKVEVRLPHKIGQPLGSSSSDGIDS